MIKLIKPCDEYKEQILNYKKEFIDNNDFSFDGCSELEECETYEEWIDFENRLKLKYGNDFVPIVQYLAIREEDKKLVGMINIRLKFTEFLYKFGGNIGYSVLPSERRKGIAKEMLRLMIEECKLMNFEKVKAFMLSPSFKK